MKTTELKTAEVKKQNSTTTAEKKKAAGVKKAVSLRNCTYERNFGLTQCGSAG